MLQTLILGSQLKETVWSGGKTSTLLIVPNSANRVFRISIATIERSSVFTEFPGLQRVHMLIAGETKLTIGSDEVKMNGNYPVHKFDGAAECRCELISQSALAFNIMHVDGIQASIEAPITSSEIQLKTGRALLKTFKGLSLVYNVFYCIRGSGTISFASESKALRRNDTLVIRRKNSDIQTKLEIKGDGAFVHAQLLVPAKLASC